MVRMQVRALMEAISWYKLLRKISRVSSAFFSVKATTSITKTKEARVRFQALQLEDMKR